MPFLRRAFTFNKRVKGQAIGLLLKFASLLTEAQEISPFHPCLSSSVCLVLLPSLGLKKETWVAQVNTGDMTDHDAGR